ncbi:hypothetical protein J6590_051979 [Homalodisca vitripennis]|nr:hypothetical protein J6590_051979 [Homalodisca vitripennis]
MNMSIKIPSKSENSQDKPDKSAGRGLEEADTLGTPLRSHYGWQRAEWPGPPPKCLSGDADLEVNVSDTPATAGALQGSVTQSKAGTTLYRYRHSACTTVAALQCSMNQCEASTTLYRYRNTVLLYDSSSSTRFYDSV